jgi:hypothetical protein
MWWFLTALLLLRAALVLESSLVALLVLKRWLARSRAGNLTATRTVSPPPYPRRAA